MVAVIAYQNAPVRIDFVFPVLFEFIQRFHPLPRRRRRSFYLFLGLSLGFLFGDIVIPPTDESLKNVRSSARRQSPNVAFRYGMCVICQRLQAEHDIVHDGFEHFLTSAAERICHLALFKYVLLKLRKADLSVDDVLAYACIPR